MLKPTLAIALCIVWGIVAWRLFGPEQANAPTSYYTAAQEAPTTDKKYAIAGLSDNLFGTKSKPAKPKATAQKKDTAPKTIKQEPKQVTPFPATQYLGYVKSEDEPATAHIRLENKIYKVHSGDSLGPLLVKKVSETSCQFRYAGGDSTLLRFRKTSPTPTDESSKLAARDH